MDIMKHILFVGLLLLVAVSIPLPGTAASGSLESADLAANNGYKAMATQSITVSSAAAVIVGTIPAGTHEIEVQNSTDGDVNYGPSNVSTSTTFPYIAKGEKKSFPGLTSLNPSIYFRARGTVATSSAIGFVAK